MSALPQIGFGTVRHRRLRPLVHAFAYGAFFIRVPMRANARAPYVSRLFGIDRARLFRLCLKDYGFARDGQPLAEVERVLAEHGIDDAAGEIWLQTFPRVFNYAFNPLSVWFCHRQDGALRAVLCEVNNTFGERHCYLLFHADGTPIDDGEALRAEKIFHVSPFCPVRGHYQFHFIQQPERSVVRVDYDDGEGPLIYTSISGTLKPLSDRALVRALLAYPLFTFGVVVRIHWQALKLFVKRVPFFSKPEPPAVEVSR